MHAISVKELRQNFPLIRSELKKGESFLIIHKSKPIAQLKPVNGENNNIKIDDEKELLEDFQNAAAADWKRFIPPITKEEHDYYMSLSPLKE